MHVLFLASNPISETSLLLEREITALQQSLGVSDVSAGVKLTAYPHVRIEHLPAVLSSVSDVLHVSAHADGEALLFTDEHEEVAPLDGEALGRLLAALRVRPRLMVLNACRGADIAAASGGRADFVISMSAPIANQAARTFAATLYGQLARGAFIQDAFDAASSVLSALGPQDLICRLDAAEGADQHRERLCEPLRLVARIPALDKTLKRGVPPPRLVREKMIEMEFGVAGAPTGACQLVVFTHDTSYVNRRDTLEKDLSWIVQERPVRGVMWVGSTGEADGDCRWFASVVTNEGGIQSTTSTLLEALNRYYIDETWRGPLPDEHGARLREAIAHLRMGDGSHR